MWVTMLQMLRCYAPPKRIDPSFFYKCYGATHLRNELIHRFFTNVTVLRTSETNWSIVFLQMLRCYAPPKRIDPSFFYKCYGATHLRNELIHRFFTKVTVLRTSETNWSIVFLQMLRCYAPPKRIDPSFFYQCYGATHLRNELIHRFSTNVTVLRTSETNLSIVFLQMLRCYAPPKRIDPSFFYKCCGATHLKRGF
jgi:hypothetical protein